VSDAVTTLPRGGWYIKTSAGPIQVGLPPETIKDSMAAGLAVPTLYVLPRNLFDRRRGVNVAECEFPAYFNFFILKRKIRLLVHSEADERRVRSVFEEALFGPSVMPSDSEFAADYSPALRPDFARESEYFRRLPDGSRLDVDMLVEFLHFDAEDQCAINDAVLIRRTNAHIEVIDHGKRIARTPLTLELAPRSHRAPDTTSFEPPEFGVTVLGSSHGFDPAGKTTGIVLWVGKRGILVDPPVDTTEYLRERGVASKLIDGVILTHCHADHDSGTFQKILEEERINVYTTPTIVGSFVKKYAALSGIGEDLLRRTFVFNPVTIGAPVRVHGAEIWFFYTLHSIPALGFEVFYGNKSLAFSGDSLYDPERLRALRDLGVLSSERCEDLIDFPWHHTVVIHEAGIPPLHTPASVLAALPEEHKERLYLVHIAEKDLPQDCGLKSARVGLEHTIHIPVERSPNDEAAQWLELLSGVEIFRELPLSRAGELLRAAKLRAFPAGTKIIQKGSRGDTFYVIASGVCAVEADGIELKRYSTGDYFGETALVLDQPRTADVVARTDCKLLEIDRYGFLYLLRGTNVPERLVRLAKMRELRSWEVFDRNSVLSQLSSGQKTVLQSYMESRTLEVGEILWSANGPASGAVLLDEAQIVLEGTEGSLAPFRTGAMVGEFDAIRLNTPVKTTARVVDRGRAYFIDRAALARFFKDNPGVLVSFLGRRFVE
jgi:CRP-like cAMP-binding protein/ribonuclease BN (tRNA processing enzyme)